MGNIVNKIRFYILLFLITLLVSSALFYNLFKSHLTTRIKLDLEKQHNNIQLYINNTLTSSIQNYFTALGDRLLIDIENLELDTIADLTNTYKFNETGYIYITDKSGVIISHPKNVYSGKNSIHKDWIISSSINASHKNYKSEGEYKHIYKLYSPKHKIYIIFESSISDFLTHEKTHQINEYIRKIANASHLYTFIISEDYSFPIEPIVAPPMEISEIIPDFKVENNYFIKSNKMNKLDVTIGYFSRNNIFNWIIAITGTSKHVTTNKETLRSIFLKSLHPVLLLILFAIVLLSKLRTEIKLKNRNQGTIKTQKELIHKLGEVIETRSKETNEHVQRVSSLSDYIAFKSGMSIEERKILKSATPLHDIGKIGIEDNILNKKGKLTASEYERIKEHTTIGYNLLKGSEDKLLKIASIIAFEHHENWDGSGYPLGKSDINISIYARIVHIADVIDALLSERTYKQPWPKERVYEFLKAESGKMFDPDLTKIVLNNFDKIINIFNNIKVLSFNY